MIVVVRHLAILLLLADAVITTPVIRWGSSNFTHDSPWYFQARQSSRQTTSDQDPESIAAEEVEEPAAVRCEEPRNLPEQFMDWFRETHSDPTMLAFMAEATDGSGADDSKGKRKSSRGVIFDDMILEPDFCTSAPSTEPDSKLMDRALCPWEWKLNRDENREPKLVSEARCLCRRSRGLPHADCVPIRREFPVLRRVFCDEHGRYQYQRSYETVVVGCHSVMPRVHKTQASQFQAKVIL